MIQISKKKIEIDKLNRWWNNLDLFSRKEIYKYWEGKE